MCVHSEQRLQSLQAHSEIRLAAALFTEGLGFKVQGLRVEGSRLAAAVLTEDTYTVGMRAACACGYVQHAPADAVLLLRQLEGNADTVCVVSGICFTLLYLIRTACACGCDAPPRVLGGTLSNSSSSYAPSSSCATMYIVA